jgi:selenocysteine lyase/cysteine desulfurase
MKRKDFFKKGLGAAVATTFIPNPWLLGNADNNHQFPSNNRSALPDDTEPQATSEFPTYGNLENPLSLDWERVRNEFSINPKLIFLNNGTMGITPAPVLKSLNDAFNKAAREAAYPHADGSLEKLIAEITGAKDTEIAITKNVSEGVNLACWAMDLKAGDEILITKHEHVGGCAPWLHRAQMDGVKLVVVELGTDAISTYANFVAAATIKTKVLAIPHIPCTIGQILPVKDLCAWAKTKGIITAIDGAHPLGMVQFNIKELGCDYYSGCLHKWVLGPLGTGWFYASEEILAKSAIRHVAAYSVDKFDMSTTPPSMGELVNKTSRYSYGTFSGPLYSGAKTALKFYQHLGPKAVETRVKYLSACVYFELLLLNQTIASKTLISDKKEKSSTTNKKSTQKTPQLSDWLSFLFGTQSWIHTTEKETPTATAWDNKSIYNWAIKHRETSALSVLTPWEQESRGAQIGFRIIPGKQPSLSQKFCDFARSKGMILRYVGENNIDCVRVSTHYYNNLKETATFVEHLREFLTQESVL